MSDSRSAWQRLVPRTRTSAVTRIGDEARTDFPAARVWRVARGVYRDGLHPALALHVRHRGDIVLDRTIGHLDHDDDGTPGVVATPDHLYGLFSASKIVTATLVHALAEDGQLDLDERIVHWIPEFGRHGKETIRLRHLLAHNAGIPWMPEVPDLDAALREGRIDLDLLYDLTPEAPPGVQVAYHAIGAWFIVQEIVERVMGKGLREVLHERLIDPMGLSTLSYGTTPDKIGQVAKHRVTGPALIPFMESTFARSVGVPFERAVALSNDPAFLTGVVPSANILAQPREVGAFVQMLLEGGRWNGEQLLQPQTIEHMVAPATPWAVDGVLKFPTRYGLGVMLGGNRFSLFGLGTRGAFGHLGLTNVVVYGDPRRDLSVVLLTTGKPLMAPGMVRWYALLQAIVANAPRR